MKIKMEWEISDLEAGTVVVDRNRRNTSILMRDNLPQAMGQPSTTLWYLVDHNTNIVTELGNAKNAIAELTDKGYQPEKLPGT